MFDPTITDRIGDSTIGFGTLKKRHKRGTEQGASQVVTA